jgi:ABC-type antimicrobial peptide transport system permease subunit
VIGLYGVRSYLVSRRSREFGVRLAIGASPADALSLVVRESLVITTVGLTMGLVVAMLLGWGLRALSDQPTRSSDSGSRHRNSRDRVARGVNHSGSTGC